jgi:hypothetical protein
LCMVVFTGVGTSVSRFLSRTAFKSPLVAFTFGFIGFHLFGYMQPECPKCEDVAAVEAHNNQTEGPIYIWLKSLFQQETELDKK